VPAPKAFDPAHLHDDTLLTVRELAQWWRVSLSHLNQARLRGDGPPFLKIGGCVRYRVSECKAFMAQRLRTSTGNTARSAADA
jgi:predicted DNA-binding transcriptional regulator AlpA